MEFVALAALASVGYFLRKDPTGDERDEDVPSMIVAVDANDDDALPGPYDDLDMPSNQLLAFDEAALKRYKDSFYPHKTGIIAPFYKTRNSSTNDEGKQRALDRFTGADPAYRKKREVEAIFARTPQNIDSSGREGNTAQYDRDIYKSSLTEKNLGQLPFQQIQVGPGLGVGTDVPAADGFHSMLRVMPADGNLHKSSELGGRVNAGSVINATRTMDMTLSHKAPPRVWDQSRRPLERGKAQIAEAMARRGVHSSVEPVQCHVDGEYYTGVAYREGAYDAHAATTRLDDRSARGDLLNLDGQKMGGHLAYTPGDPYRITSQNREAKTGPGPVAPVRTKENLRCSNMQLLKQAKRGSYPNPEYMAGPQRNDALLLARLGYRTSPYTSQIHKFRAEMDGTKNRLLSHPQSGALDRGTTQDTLGSFASNGRKITGETNPRADFTLAAAAMAGNPYKINA